MLLARRLPAFHWRTLRESGGVEEAGGVEEQPGARDGGEGVEGEDIKWAHGGKEVWRRGWGGSAALTEGAPDCTMEVYMSEKSEEGVTVLWQGGSSKSESCQEL